MRRLFYIPLLMLTGCFTHPVSVSLLPPKPQDNLFGAIPHFDIVSKENSAYRGGQPTKAGFDYLHNVLGVQTILKLNEDSEGSDAYAEQIGMTVVKFPITLSQQVFGGFDFQKLNLLVQENFSHVFIHCEHGQDRTGVACYLYKTRVLNVDKVDAVNDMLSHGFHKELFGLWRAVEND